jgi:transposase-like protein
VRNGTADGLQRYRCRGCRKTFNALTGTPLDRLRHKGKWLDQTGALADGLTVHRAAERLGVAPSTAFRWRHRFLALPRQVEPAVLTGVVEVDETYVLESFKGQKVIGRAARKRGGPAAKRGLSREQIPILVARDRSGATTDYVLTDSRKGAVTAVLKSLLSVDAVVCTDGGGSIGQAVKDLGLEHHPVVTSRGVHAIGAWHISRTQTLTTGASRAGCAASTASPRPTWRTISAGSVPWTVRPGVLRNLRSCSTSLPARSVITS